MEETKERDKPVCGVEIEYVQPVVSGKETPKEVLKEMVELYGYPDIGDSKSIEFLWHIQIPIPIDAKWLMVQNDQERRRITWIWKWDEWLNEIYCRKCNTKFRLLENLSSLAKEEYDFEAPPLVDKGKAKCPKCGSEIQIFGQW